MNISCIIVFSNDQHIIDIKKQFRHEKIGWTLNIWELVNYRGSYYWERKSIWKAHYIMNYEKRKIKARGLAREHKLPILYRDCISIRNSLGKLSKTISFCDNDLYKLVYVNF